MRGLEDTVYTKRAIDCLYKSSFRILSWPVWTWCQKEKLKLNRSYNLARTTTPKENKFPLVLFYNLLHGVDKDI